MDAMDAMRPPRPRTATPHRISEQRGRRGGFDDPGRDQALSPSAAGRAGQGRDVPVIVGVHSVYVDGDTISVGFDIAPGDDPLYIELKLPVEVGRNELTSFARWLVDDGQRETAH
jgi:hypothetical protein